jgi:hypothetical protein
MSASLIGRLARTTFDLMEHFGGLKDSKTDDRQAVATADQVCEGYASECVRLAGLTEDQHIRDRL